MHSRSEVLGRTLAAPFGQNPYSVGLRRRAREGVQGVGSWRRFGRREPLVIV